MNVAMSAEQLKRWQEEDEGYVSAGRMTFSEAISYAKGINDGRKPHLKKALPTSARTPKRPLVKVEASCS